MMNKASYIILLLTGLLTVSCVRSDDGLMEEYVKPGDSLPEFSVSGPAETFYNSADAPGNITLICFFNTTCPDCHRELPKLEYVWGHLKITEVFEMVCIGRERTLPEIQSYWDQESFSMPYYEDPLRSVYSLFATMTVPRIYLVDEEGIVREMWVEEINLTQQQLLETIKLYIERL